MAPTSSCCHKTFVNYAELIPCRWKLYLVITILVLSDERPTLESLCSDLREQSDFRVHPAPDLDQVKVLLASNLKPDIVLLDSDETDFDLTRR